MTDVHYEPDVEDHFRWVKDNSVFGTCGDKLMTFLPSPTLKSRFQEDNNSQLRRLLRAGNVDVSLARSIAQSYCAVFEILLRIRHPAFIDFFIERDISDAKLPLTKDADFPESAGPDFPKLFTDEQWRYCVRPLSLDFRKFDKHTILPFVKEEKPFNEKGSGSRLFRIKTCKYLKDTKRTLALKAYFGPDAKKNCRAEGMAYRKLHGNRKSPAVIDFFSSFRHGNDYFTVLEYADGGSLEDLFHKPEPKSPAEILTFYERLLKLCTAIMHIVNVQEPNSNAEQFWHQDIKPENILVVSSTTSKDAVDDYPWKFKLADFGESHFKTLPLDGDSRGSTTYGSPECYRSDCDVLRMKLKVSPKVDVWSLGAVFSEAIAWVVFGTQGLERYRLERANENKDRWIQDNDCFHNGEVRLTAVDRFLDEAKLSSRMSDFATKLVADLVPAWLLVPEEDRLEAKQLHGHGKRIITEARKFQGKIDNGLLKLLYPQYETTVTGPSPIATELFSSIQAADGAAIADSQSHKALQSDELSPSQVKNSEQLLESTSSTRPVDYIDTNTTTRTINSQPVSPDDRTSSLSAVDHRRNSVPLNNVPNNQQLPNLFSSVSIPAGLAMADEKLHVETTDSTSMLQGNGIDHTKLRVSNDQNARISGESASPSSNGYHQSKKSQEKEIRETSRDIRHLTLEDVFVWYNRAKASKSKIPFKGSRSSIVELEDAGLISHHRGMDHVFLIDDAISMQKHWSDVQRLFAPLVYLIKFHKLDKDGQDLYFATHKKRLTKQKNTTKLIKTVHSMPISNVESDLPKRLADLLHTYQQKLNEFTSSKGLQIYVLTDGKWQSRSDLAAESSIRTLIKRLDETSQPQNKVGIQFIRFGNDPEGKARLDRLDRLKTDEKVTRDIVDTEPFDGNIWKILIGATNDTYDDDDDTRACRARL